MIFKIFKSTAYILKRLQSGKTFFQKNSVKHEIKILIKNFLLNVTTLKALQLVWEKSFFALLSYAETHIIIYYKNTANKRHFKSTAVSYRIEEKKVTIIKLPSKLFSFNTLLNCSVMLVTYTNGNDQN